MDDTTIITLFYDTDNAGQDGIQITDCDPIFENDLMNQCTWNTSNLSDGNYYIYGVISDGIHSPVIDYSDGAVTVTHAKKSYLLWTK